MLKHDDLLRLLAARGNRPPDASSDYPTSISSAVIRGEIDGERVVAVGAERSPETRIGALLDLLQLHHDQRSLRVATDGVTLIVGNSENEAHEEVLQALGTLVSQYRGPERIRVLTDEDGELVEVPLTAADFSTSAMAASWREKLDRFDAGAPELVTRLVAAVGEPALRAYPMLTKWPVWSLRLEGLIVAQLDGESGWLDVGKEGKAGAASAQRESWMAATDGLGRVAVKASSVEAAATVLRRFASLWLDASAGHEAEQNEHALESRILRGAVPVALPDGTELAMIRPDPLINWGSQFPTQWSNASTRNRHFLDALLHDGPTPWALELKVESGGSGSYYRHGVAQAVLYRHFIRTARPVHPWFTHQGGGLDAEQCEAALVVPRMGNRQAKRAAQLRRITELFTVALVEVDPEATLLRRSR